MKLLAVTGGIACGKSTVINEIEKMENVVVIDSDKIAKGALDIGGTPYEKLSAFVESSDEYKAYYDQIFDKENGGAVNRELLGSLIFKDPSFRKQLNSFTHGWIFRKIVDRIWEEWRTSEKYDDKVVVLDSPLLFETKVFTKVVDKIIVVTTSDQNQLKRLMSRNQLSEEEAKNRIASQMPNSEKERLADYVIHNDADLETLKQTVNDVFEQCRKEASHFGFLALSTLTAFRAYSQLL